MSVQTYIKDPKNGFSAAEQLTLDKWRAHFDKEMAWKLIGRNFDRECDRKDINHVLLCEFFRDVALAYLPLLPDAPIAVIDRVLAGRRSRFLLPGVPLREDKLDIARVLRADHLVKYQLHTAGIAITMELDPFIAAVQAGTFDGKDMAGSQMGRPCYPVWVCPAKKLPAAPDSCRDELGLQHIAHGHLMSISYPRTILDSEHLALRAPTALDGAMNGAENWIFAKRKSPGGPGWGHAVDINKCAAGVDEAVHGDFRIDSVKSMQINLAYVGEITASPPQVIYANLLTHI